MGSVSKPDLVIMASNCHQLVFIVGFKLATVQEWHAGFDNEVELVCFGINIGNFYITQGFWTKIILELK